MTNVKENKIRQGKNLVNLKGELIKKQVKTFKTKKGEDFITAKLDIEVGENNIILVSMFSFKLDKDGGIRPMYKTIETIENDFIERKEKEGGEIEYRGDILLVRSSDRFSAGSVDLNEFYGQNGLISNLQVSARSIHRMRAGEEELPSEASFILEGYISKKKMGVNEEGDMDGTMEIELLTPNYSGRVDKFVLSVNNPEYTEAINSTYEVGQTATFLGQVMNQITTTKKITELAFGGVHEDVVTNVKRGLVVTGGTLPKEEGIDPTAYSKKEIEVALKERDMYLEELKEKFEKNSKKSSGGMGESAFGTSNVESKATGLNIPF